MTERYDLIVLGGGAAGLTAALYGARSHLKTLVLDTGTPGGQMNLTYKVANYPGVPETSGADIVMTMRRQVESFGARLISHVEVTDIDLGAAEKTIVVEDEGTFVAPTVILAPGATPRTLGLPSEARFQGRGISYCATCDGDFFTGQDIAVVGGGNSALEEAVSLTKFASSVTVIHEFDHFQAQPWAVEQAMKNPKIRFLMEQTVKDFEGEAKLTAVIAEHKRTHEVTRTPVSGVFLFIGYVPNTGWLREQIAVNERGEILTDESMKTNVAGVFAAGDARKKRYRQITTAVADGAIAAIAASEYVAELNARPDLEPAPPSIQHAAQ